MPKHSRSQGNENPLQMADSTLTVLKNHTAGGTRSIRKTHPSNMEREAMPWWWTLQQHRHTVSRHGATEHVAAKCAAAHARPGRLGVHSGLCRRARRECRQYLGSETGFKSPEAAAGAVLDVRVGRGQHGGAVGADVRVLCSEQISINQLESSISTAVCMQAAQRLAQ